MSKYREIIYPNDKKNPYPKRLIGYIYDRFMRPTKSNNTVSKVGS